MAKVRPDGTKMIGFNAPDEMVEALDKISIRKWGKKNMTAVLYEAAAQYIEREELGPSPEVEDLFRRALKNREIVAEVAEALRQYEGRKPAKRTTG